MRNKWLKLSKLDSQKIKSLLDFADLEKAKQNQSKKDITEILNFIANLNEKKLCDFYNKIDNNIEKLFTLSLHIDLLLRKIISLYKNISINELEESETYDLINYLYLLSIIDSKIINIDEENFFERLHSFRILRNRFA
ncbi:MAG: hypothetical protein PHF54_03115, partial [Candidatus Pacebacteria bacterium]|nr:hypothetical protein [Candidatus Paceibacterota bacterium]